MPPLQSNKYLSIFAISFEVFTLGYGKLKRCSQINNRLVNKERQNLFFIQIQFGECN